MYTMGRLFRKGMTATLITGRSSVVVSSPLSPVVAEVVFPASEVLLPEVLHAARLRLIAAARTRDNSFFIRFVSFLLRVSPHRLCGFSVSPLYHLGTNRVNLNF